MTAAAKLQRIKQHTTCNPTPSKQTCYLAKGCNPALLWANRLWGLEIHMKGWGCHAWPKQVVEILSRDTACRVAVTVYRDNGPVARFVHDTWP